MSNSRQRLFVGVPVSAGVEVAASVAQASIEARGLRMLRPEQLHVTLAFLGEVGKDVAAASARVVSDQGGTMGGVAHLAGFVLLPTPRKVRVVALAIEDVEGVLGRLYSEISDGLIGAGVMEAERRPFRPHLTIARLREAGRVHLKSDLPRERFSVRSVCLYRSTLTREGAEYEILTEAILRDRQDTEV
ncbi:MAG: RNA 2',3'-cyclic phosphodiesterase [Thermoleophilia bacterium]